MGYALLDHRFCSDYWPSDLGSFAFLGGYDMEISYVDSQRVSMNWCLRYEAIGQRKSENAGHEGSTAKEEEVPVETAWLLQWKLSCLCTDTANVLCGLVST